MTGTVAVRPVVGMSPVVTRVSDMSAMSAMSAMSGVPTVSGVTDIMPAMTAVATVAVLTNSTECHGDESNTAHGKRGQVYVHA